MLADFSNGCIIYVDESGSFARRSTFDGVVSVVVPAAASTMADLRRFVEGIEADADDSEKRRGEVKGSALRIDRFDGIIRFVCQQGLFVGPSCVHRSPSRSPAPEPFVPEPFVPTDIRAARICRIEQAQRDVQESGLKARADQLVEAFTAASEEDLWYGMCVWLSMLAVFERLAKRLLPRSIMVVLDPRLAAKYQPMLEYFSGEALLSVIEHRCPEPFRGWEFPPFVLGGGKNPLRFRAPLPIDRAGLQLADWLTYLHTAANREDHPHQDRYREKLGRYDHYCIPG